MKPFKYTALLVFAIVLCLTGCGDNDESDEFWEAISLINKSKTVAFVFSSTEIDKCGEHAQPNLEKVLNDKKTNIKSSKVNGFMLFPSITDKLYSTVAEELKFLYDNNGNGTFKAYPSFVSNMTCLDIDTISWFDSLEVATSQLSPITMGTRESSNGNQFTVYVKGKYSSPISKPHSVALYLYKNKIEGTQNTLASGVKNFTHKNVIFSSITNTYGKNLSAAQSNEEFHEKFNFDLSDESRDEVGILIIVFELKDGVPYSVINSLAI